MSAAAPETPATPGQAALSPSAYAAYEAYAMAAPDELNFREPDKLDDWEYPAWEAAAQAAYETRADEEDLAARQPQPAPGDAGCPDPGQHVVIRDFLTGRELSHAETDGTQPAPGVWTVAECLERIGDLAGALHEIKNAYASGTFAHDLAHATLDQRGPAEQPAPGLQLGPCPFDGHDGEHLRLNTHGHWLCAIQLTNMLVAAGVITDLQPEQPAPGPAAATPPLGTAWRLLGEAREELAGVTAERGQLLRELTDVLDWFAATGSGYTARVSGVRLARQYRRSRVPLPERLKHLEGQ